MEKGKLKQAIDACAKYDAGNDDDIIYYDNYINAKNAIKNLMESFDQLKDNKQKKTDR